jgi:hypothetical protein
MDGEKKMVRMTYRFEGSTDTNDVKKDTGVQFQKG